MTVLFLYIISLFNITSFEPVEAETAIQWYSWEEALALSETSPKKVFVDVYTSWCGWCKKMDRTTFKDPKVVKYLNDNFYAVKFDAEQKEPIIFNGKTFEFMNAGRRGVHQLAYALLDGRMGYPAFVMLDESFARIMISPGYKVTDQLMKELVFAKEETYKEMSWEVYVKSAD